MPRYVLLLRLEYQPVIKWRGNGMGLQPLSKAAEIYSCPSLLSSSKRQAVSLFVGDKKKIAHCHSGGNLKVSRVGIQLETQQRTTFCASPTPLFLTVIAVLWLFFFCSNPFLWFFWQRATTGDIQPKFPLQMKGFWPDRVRGRFTALGSYGDSSQLLSCSLLLKGREAGRGEDAGLDKLLVFHCWLPGG